MAFTTSSILTSKVKDEKRKVKAVMDKKFFMVIYLHLVFC
jgi:hypothetical protein